MVYEIVLKNVKTEEIYNFIEYGLDEENAITKAVLNLDDISDIELSSVKLVGV